MKTILFDLDGTLLSMDAEKFERTYLGSLIDFYKEKSEPKALSHALGKSIYNMIASDDLTKTNEQVFFESFSKLVDSTVYDHVLETMDTYYNNNFNCVKEITSFSPSLVEAVRNLRKKGHKVILATNPLLPKIATDKRIEWAGFKLDDFDHITRFEEYHTCKPNINYYKEIIERCDLDPSNCIMVGNDIQEDGVSKDLGMKLWIINDDLIDRGTGGSYDWIGTRDSLSDKLKNID